MRFSLSSRFRGTLLGTVVGQTLEKSSCEWERLLVPGTQSLIKMGRFDLEDWCKSFNKVTNRVSCEATIATLSLSIFEHENEVKLRRNLQLAASASWRDDPVSRDCTLAVGHAIAQCLTERININTLIPQTVAFLGQPQTQIAEQLTQVQTMLEQQAGWERVQAELTGASESTLPVTIAFYCFLSTVEDLRLAIMRAAQNNYQPQITTAITGALSGAYNSKAGIPASLQLILSQSGSKSLAKIIELSDSLLTVWSGVYDQTLPSDELMQTAAIAAPRIISP